MSEPPAEPCVEARGLGKSYGLLPVLRGIDLDVASGQIVGLLGPNGAGKSTLLRCLAGTSRPSAGRLRLLGADCHPGRPPRRALARVGLVGHDPLVYLDLSPRENLSLFARLYGCPSGSVEGALSRFGLSAFADRPSRRLSRGTLQRLALARALLHEPRLLLLDEPFTGLDEGGRRVLDAALRQRAAAGTAAVVVSHELGPLAALADRIVIVAQGRIVADRTPPPAGERLAELYRSAVGKGPQHVDDPS